MQHILSLRALRSLACFHLGFGMFPSWLSEERTQDHAQRRYRAWCCNRPLLCRQGNSACLDVSDRDLAVIGGVSGEERYLRISFFLFQHVLTPGRVHDGACGNLQNQAVGRARIRKAHRPAGGLLLQKWVQMSHRFARSFSQSWIVHLLAQK